MAGHSKWASIKHKKKAVDAKRGALFTKLTRAITVAAREGGGDPEGNPSLALAIQKAKDASMPKDNIERAIAKGTGADADADAFEAVLYEGYGPGGVAVLVEALTDNRNRTGSEVRNIFTKHGGNLGEPGSVAWTFEKKGEIVVDGSRYSEDDLLPAIDAGAEDVALDGDVWEVVTGPAELAAVRQALESAGVEIDSAELVQRPTTRTPVEEDRVAHAHAADRRARGERRRAGRARELRRGRRGAGAGGRRLMRARLGAAAFWLVAGTMHFVIPRQYEAIVPPSLARWKKELVVASGIAEIAGGAAILPERTRRGCALVAAGHARGRLPGEHPHGGPRGAVPEDPGSRALGAAAGSGDLRLLTWRGTR